MKTAATLVATLATSLVLAGTASAGTTLRLHNKTVHFKQHADGSLVIRQRVTDRDTGKRVGRLRVVLHFPSKHEADGKVKLTLAGGTLRLSFVSDPDEDVTHGTVKGGTGDYQGASGSFRDVAIGGENSSEDNLTIHLK